MIAGVSWFCLWGARRGGGGCWGGLRGGLEGGVGVGVVWGGGGGGGGGCMCVLRLGQYRFGGDSVKFRKRMVKIFDREYFADYLVMKITIRSCSNYFAYYMVVRITIDL